MLNLYDAIVVVFFHFFYVLHITLWKCCLEVPIGVWVKIFYIKKCLLAPLPESSRSNINSCFVARVCSLIIKGLSTLHFFWYAFSRIRAEYGDLLRNWTKIATQLRVTILVQSPIVNRLPVKSHTSLCLIVIKPPFLQVIACCISILWP